MWVPTSSLALWRRPIGDGAGPGAERRAWGLQSNCVGNWRLLVGRRPKSPIEMLLAGASRLSWPVCIAIAAVAFVVLRWLSFQSPATVEMGEGFGSALAWNFGIQIAAGLQWLLPAMILVGVLVGSLRRGRQSGLVGEMRQSGAAGIKGLSWKKFRKKTGTKPAERDARPFFSFRTNFRTIFSYPG